MDGWEKEGREGGREKTQSKYAKKLTVVEFSVMEALIAVIFFVILYN